MGNINKAFALLLTLIIALSCLTVLIVKPANAQSIPTPSVPKFTVKLTSFPNTQNYSIQISIDSQPYAYSYNGSLYQEYFNIRVKEHSAQNWTEFYPIINGTKTWNGGEGVVQGPEAVRYFSYAEYVSSDSPIQSDSGATVNFYVTPIMNYLDDQPIFGGYAIQRAYSYFNQGEPYNRTFLDGVPIDAQLDFQVQALVGHNSTVWYNISALWAGIGGYIPAVAYDSASGWSNTQTVVAPANSSTPNNPQGGNQELTNITLSVIATVAVAAIAILLVYIRKIWNQLPKQ